MSSISNFTRTIIHTLRIAGNNTKIENLTTVWRNLKIKNVQKKIWTVFSCSTACHIDELNSIYLYTYMYLTEDNAHTKKNEVKILYWMMPAFGIQ